MTHMAAFLSMSSCTKHFAWHLTFLVNSNLTKMFQNMFMQYVVLKCSWLHHFDYSFVCIVFVFLQKQSLMYMYVPIKLE